MRNETDIKRLIEDFFDGKTSVAEEKELYRYFSTEDIAESLRKYKPMFLYLETEMCDELNALPQDEYVIDEKPRKKKMYLILTAVAASLLLILLLNPFANPFEGNPYEGSYTIVDGEKVYLSDVALIERMEKQILAEAAKEEQSVYNQFASAREQQTLYASIEEKAISKEMKYQKIENNINAKIEKYEELTQSAD